MKRIAGHNVVTNHDQSFGGTESFKCVSCNIEAEQIGFLLEATCNDE